MKTLALFNNKGGVGKTSLVYHLAWMFAELKIGVVAIDLDPQSNLTSSFLDDDQLEKLWASGDGGTSILGLVQPLLDRLGDIGSPQITEIEKRIGLVPGNLGLSLFEDRLAETWGKCLDDNVANAADAFRVTTAFYRIMQRAAIQRDASLVLIDVGPNLGAINRAALVAADFVVVPLAADLFSLQGLRNLGPTLRTWRNGWSTRKVRVKPGTLDALPSGDMRPVGYIVMQPSVRARYPVKAYRKWADRIPRDYCTQVLDPCVGTPIPDPDPNNLAILKNYRSLAPLAQEARVPMFSLRPADGAIGGHGKAVTDCYKDFSQLVKRIADICGFTIPSASRRN